MDHVGDSRIYRLRNGNLSCLTTDHTFAQEMLEAREIEVCDVESHPLRNMLTHVVGGDEALQHIQARNRLCLRTNCVEYHEEM